MSIHELDGVGVIWRLLGALCSGYLVWSLLAQDRMLLRQRRWFYNRFPPDGYLYMDGTPVPDRFMKVEKWGSSYDPRLTPIGLRSFTRITNLTFEVTSGSPVQHDGPLPSPCLLQHEAKWHLVGGDQFVEGWVKHTPKGLLLLTEGENLPRWRVEKDSLGNWAVPDDSGTWLGNWLQCSRCSGLWFAVISTLVVMLANTGVVVLLGLCAVSGVAVRFLAKLLPY